MRAALAGVVLVLLFCAPESRGLIFWRHGAGETGPVEADRGWRLAWSDRVVWNGAEAEVALWQAAGSARQVLLQWAASRRSRGDEVLEGPGASGGWALAVDRATVRRAMVFQAAGLQPLVLVVTQDRAQGLPSGSRSWPRDLPRVPGGIPLTTWTTAGSGARWATLRAPGSPGAVQAYLDGVLRSEGWHAQGAFSQQGLLLYVRDDELTAVGAYSSGHGTYTVVTWMRRPLDARGAGKDGK